MDKAPVQIDLESSGYKSSSSQSSPVLRVMTMVVPNYSAELTGMACFLSGFQNIFTKSLEVD